MDAGEIFEVETKYDSLGRLSELLYPERTLGGRLTVTQTYGPQGRLSKVLVDGKDTWGAVSRDDYGAVTDARLGADIHLTTAFDPWSRRPAHIQMIWGNPQNDGAVLFDQKQTYLDDGRVESRHDLGGRSVELRVCARAVAHQRHAENEPD